MSIIQSVGSGEVSTGFYPHSINQSLRFNDDDESHLDRTMVSPTDNKKYTMAFWVKRCSLGSFQFIFTAGTSPNGYFSFNDDDTIKIRNAAGSHDFVTTQKFRDIGAWYHFTYSFDSANSIAKLYVNGTQVTDFSTQVQPGANEASVINSAVAHVIGNFSANGLYDIDMYLAEFYFVDGHALTPSTFGETKNDIWVAKNASPTIKALTNGFGNNGFHLTFSDSSDIGADSSGEGHDFTPDSAFQASDVVLDSPTNNFATLDNLSTLNTGSSISDGNLTWSIGGADGAGKANFVMTSGKWYCEVGVAGAVSDYVGLVSGNASLVNVNMSQSILYNEGGQYRKNGSMISYGASFASTDIISIALDLDSGTQTVEFFKNNASQGTINLTDVGSEGYAFACGSGSGGRSATFNFGQDSTGISSAQSDENGIGTFEYAPPSGFLALCTANFPDPAIDPNAGETPDQYFDTILYQAATSNGTYTRGSIAFTPDWSWIKNRDNVERHLWADVIRGNTSMTDKWLVSDRGAAEGANGVDGTTFSVTSSGYQFVETSIDTGELFFNNRLYVGWNWKAGGAPSADNSAGVGATPTAGSVKIDGANLGTALAGTLAAKRISASTEAGFSIVAFEAPSTGSKTVAHGLSSAPEMIIFKSRSNATGWIIQHAGIADDAFTDFISFTTSPASDNDTVSDDTAPTSSVFTIGSGFTSGNYGTNQIAYCFHSVDGFSKFGSYIGNQDPDGTFVYTGFRPAWLMIKNADFAEIWPMFDNKRDTFNPVQNPLYADLTSTESPTSSRAVDFLSNGFKIRGSDTSVNRSGDTHIYMAFADQPFKYSNAR